MSLIHCGTPGPWAIWDSILWSITMVMHMSHLDILLGCDAGGTGRAGGVLHLRDTPVLLLWLVVLL